ncbi:MAG: hypothetical protein Q8K48_07910 [Candidatus Planktophila sp.]|nr:antitoxin [Candidatus Saccharibacteria bacterium]MDP1852320.1 hypothetical protein [Candidatus Planktophila sp.]
MADLLIRNLSLEVLQDLDIKAANLGISRAEYVRRTLTQISASSIESVTEQHLKNLIALLPDLANEEIMDGAWR